MARITGPMVTRIIVESRTAARLADMVAQPPHVPPRGRLPMESLLEALAAWERDPAGAHAGLAESVQAMLSVWGADGARIRWEAPRRPALDLTLGTLARGSSERVPLTTGGFSRETGFLEVAGPAESRGPLARAIALALDLTWARGEARSAARQMEALDEASAAVAGELDLERVLQLIVDRLRPLIGARYAALGLVGASGEFERFITSGIDDQARARIGHIPRGLGLLGQVVEDGRAIRSRDVMADPRRHGFPAHHPAMHSFLGVPVTVQSASVGNLYLTEKEGSAEFTEADEGLVRSFARHAGIAIERARLHAQVQHLAIGQERERIGRELHDGIIQSLYAVGLGLEDVPDLMADAPQEATFRVERAIDAIHAAIRDIRNFITGLRPEALEEGDLLSGLEELVDQARRGGIATVILDTGDSRDMHPSLAMAFLQAAREAVSNAVRHAAAARLELRLEQQGDLIVLTVVDDGSGFEFDLPFAGDRRLEHNGLRNLYARARAMGGDAVLSSEPGKGTRLEFRLPQRLAGEGTDD